MTEPRHQLSIADIARQLKEMRQEHREEHMDLKSAIQEIGTKLAKTELDLAVHGAVCEQDRKQLKAENQQQSKWLWKLIAAVLAGGTAAGGAASYLLKSLGG